MDIVMYICAVYNQVVMLVVAVVMVVVCVCVCVCVTLGRVASIA